MNNLHRFHKWLSDRGCEILPPTNQYETIRFKGKEVGVIYTTGRFNNEFAKNAYCCFLENKKWDGKPITVGRQNSYVKQKRKLVERDGTCCFYCGEELQDDVTVEHLISLNRGGTNDLSNMVLAHEKCNNHVRNIPISEKVKFAISNRSK